MNLEIRIHEVAKKRGIKTAYGLQKVANLSPSNAARLYNNNIVQISIETLGKLCEVLDCEASDLFVRRKSAPRSRTKAKT
ncbi:MAG: helix-turn-helix transcriptional regulator [Pyrinomonadaceae bacterium]|nr:helix-turn-helix transcriptional regulator [Pyrinomonadaceae bacterium]